MATMNCPLEDLEPSDAWSVLKMFVLNHQHQSSRQVVLANKESKNFCLNPHGNRKQVMQWAHKSRRNNCGIPFKKHGKD
ncbi:uncharacterized protein G2W53_044527 [Senna tora]|uniref:Uncharacterized protein n=1 Tax=Senna tora TaxID=362788 RepID=A0A834SDL3_9FABA|nr:uncharacterized protein G2W53_044527 [Senna tora]